MCAALCYLGYVAVSLCHAAMIRTFVLMLEHQKRLDTTKIINLKTLLIFMQRQPFNINNFLAYYMVFDQYLVHYLSCKSSTAAHPLFLKKDLEARCDMTTLPLLSPEPRAKGCFTEIVVTIEHAEKRTLGAEKRKKGAEKREKGAWVQRRELWVWRREKRVQRREKVVRRRESVLWGHRISHLLPDTP